MISEQSIGKVCIAPRGEYNSSIQYYPLDLITFGGGSYIAKQKTSGNSPTDTTYWQLIASGGAGSVSVDSKGILYWA